MELALGVIGVGLFILIVRGDFTDVLMKAVESRMKKAESKARVAEANAEAEKAQLEQMKLFQKS